MTDYKLFEVRNLSRTLAKHTKKIDDLNTRMEELGIDYHDILGDDAWQTIDTEVENSLQLIESMGLKQTDRQIARIINDKTRTAIAGSLKFYEMPRSWDTAFFMAHYMKTIEGMAEILQGINYRRK